ncbi:MAG TPA: DUF5615 family PIN-like protein [Syntrophomonadaceae bacterium]|nr:DUF5615 family PIN-like protein [Syntrophomonadaceae bacterium]
MRFLIDVCVGGRLSVWLSEIGHDVKEVRSINPSMSDEEIMELALI